MPDPTGISPFHGHPFSQAATQPQQKATCFNGGRSVRPVDIGRYMPAHSPLSEARQRQLKDRKVGFPTQEQTTLNRLKQDLTKTKKENNERYKTLHHKIKVATNAKAIDPVLSELNNPRLFGTYLSAQQKQTLLDAITLKKLEFLPDVPTGKPKPRPPVTGQYKYSDAMHMSKAQLKELADKAYGVNALLYCLDITAGAFNQKLKPSEKNEIRIKLIPKINKAKEKANNYHYPALKAELLRAKTSQQILTAEKRLLAVDRLMTTTHRNELHNLLRLAKLSLKS